MLICDGVLGADLVTGRQDSTLITRGGPSAASFVYVQRSRVVGNYLLKIQDEPWHSRRQVQADWSAMKSIHAKTDPLSTLRSLIVACINFSDCLSTKYPSRMAPITNLEHLTNPLVTLVQLYSLQDDDRSRAENGQSLRYAQALLTQAAGVLLRLPQEVIATALVLLQRFWVEGHGQGHATADLKTASEASIYLSAKLSFTTVSPRSVCNVYAYLTSTSSPLPFINPTPPPSISKLDPSSYYVSEGSYERDREKILLCESLMLSSIGFDTQVALPHTLALTYLQALGVSSKKLASRVLEHLNSGLLSPQLLYLTHQPNALAVAATYLAAKEDGVKLVDGNWWEVFDVDREDLGFLVLAFGSFEGFAAAEQGKWSNDSDSLRKLLKGG